MTTAEKVREKRLEKHLTQDQMERLTGIDQAHISMIESGRRKRVSAELMVRIAQALVEYLLDVDSGLLVAPRPALRSLLGRGRKGG